MIFDEVITGFRLSFGGMAEITGVRPDIVTYGKVIGGGFPVGAYAARNEIMNMIAPMGPVYQAGTLSANPIAMVAGLATLSQLFEKQPYQELNDRLISWSTDLEQRVNQLNLPVKSKIQQVGSLFWLAFHHANNPVDTIRTPAEIPAEHPEVFTASFHKLLAKGFYLAPSAYEVGFLSTAHQDSDLEKLSEAILSSF